LTELSVSDQWPFIVVAGTGVGLVLSPPTPTPSTGSRKTATGEATAAENGVPKHGADEVADAISQGGGGGEAPAHLHGPIAKVVDIIPHDFALASRTVFYGVAIAMAIALVGMPGGKGEEEKEDETVHISAQS
jgi:hypothetical protein